MPRNARCVLPGLPYHVTQRGTDHQRVFFLNADRELYLQLLSRNLRTAHCRLLAYALMTNHVHAVIVPDRADSLAVLFRRVHGVYAQYLNTRRGRSGHLWQGRFYSCPLADSHLATALRYVEENPCRAGLVERPEDYRWSSAAVHLRGVADPYHIVDRELLDYSGPAQTDSVELLPDDQTEALRRCTYSGRPFGAEHFVAQLEVEFGRVWRRQEFEKMAAHSAGTLVECP